MNKTLNIKHHIFPILLIRNFMTINTSKVGFESIETCLHEGFYCKSSLAESLYVCNFHIMENMVWIKFVSYYPYSAEFPSYIAHVSFAALILLGKIAKRSIVKSFFTIILDLQQISFYTIILSGR